MANGRCRLHGGKTPSGSASPHFKHGRWSKYLPNHLASQYDLALRDPTLCRAHDEIALLDLRLGEFCRRLSTGESGESWLSLARTMRHLRSIDKASINAEEADDDELLEKLKLEREQAIDTIEHLVIEGVGEEAQWNAIGEQVEARRKLVDTETRRRSGLLVNVPVEQVATLIASYEALILENVQPAKQKHVSDELSRLSKSIGLTG